jgi:hypothetical protein
MTICNVCGTELPKGAGPHAFLCLDHHGLVPKKEARAYADVCKRVDDWHRARRRAGIPHQPPPDELRWSHAAAYVAARDAARDAHERASQPDLFSAAQRRSSYG